MNTLPKDEERCRAMARDKDGPTNDRCRLPLGHEGEWHRDSIGAFRAAPAPEDPWKAVAAAIGETCSEREDAPAERSGDGWEGRIGGFCPVQGEGTVDGLNWYFRARHEAWSFEVWREPFVNGELPQAPPMWWAQAEYGDGDHDASWMRSSHAWQYIEASIATGRACNWASPSEGEEGVTK